MIVPPCPTLDLVPLPTLRTTDLIQIRPTHTYMWDDLCSVARQDLCQRSDLHIHTSDLVLTGRTSAPWIARKGPIDRSRLPIHSAGIDTREGYRETYSESNLPYHTHKPHTYKGNAADCLDSGNRQTQVITHTYMCVTILGSVTPKTA